MKRRLARPAQNDIAAILDWSDKHFGEIGRRRYERLIGRGLAAITHEDPPSGRRNGGDVQAALRLFHLRHVRHDPDAQAVGQPRRLIVYRIVGPDLVVVLRILHEAMNLPSHLAPEGWID